jgi:hypothetical protein
MRKEDLFPDMEQRDPSGRIRDSVTRIRNLRGQVGQDGLTPAASRSLIDELARVLEEVARALEGGRE